MISLLGSVLLTMLLTRLTALMISQAAPASRRPPPAAGTAGAGHLLGNFASRWRPAGSTASKQEESHRAARQMCRSLIS
jgi:hypothetical protein